MSFIDEHRDLFGVEPICRALCEHGSPIASSTYRAVNSGLSSIRQRRDERLTPEIRRVHGGNFHAFGARKVWLTLNREGIPVARWRYRMAAGTALQNTVAADLSKQYPGRTTSTLN